MSAKIWIRYPLALMAALGVRFTADTDTLSRMDRMPELTPKVPNIPVRGHSVQRWDVTT